MLFLSRMHQNPNPLMRTQIYCSLKERSTLNTIILIIKQHHFVISAQSDFHFRGSCFIILFRHTIYCLTVTWREPVLEQELGTIPEHLILPPGCRVVCVVQSLIFCVLFSCPLVVFLSFLLSVNSRFPVLLAVHICDVYVVVLYVNVNVNNY